MNDPSPTGEFAPVLEGSKYYEILVTSSLMINLTNGVGESSSVKPVVPSLTILMKGYSSLYWLSLEND